MEKTQQPKRQFSTVATIAGAVLALLCVNPDADAAAGDLDPTFGAGGISVTSFGSFNSSANAIALQADGRIVTAGAVDVALFDSLFGLTRRMPEGNLDPGFGMGGRVTTAFDLGQGASGVAVQPDGKIVAVGSTQSGLFALARYTTQGALDAGFGTGGRVTTKLVDGSSGASAVALQPDGKILAVGYASGTLPDGLPGNAFALVRYSTTGTLDPSFGLGGIVAIPFAVRDARNLALAVALQPDGKIIAAGRYGARPTMFAMMRYNGDGSLDRGFGANGAVITAIGSVADQADQARAIALQADGKIILAGTTGSSSGSSFALVRYTALGALDASFGNGGKVITSIGTSSEATGAALQPNGKLLAVGSGNQNGAQSFALARYDSNGGLDSTFGSGGVVNTTVGGPGGAGAAAVVLQPDNKIVVAGTSTPLGSLPSMTVARYLGDPIVAGPIPTLSPSVALTLAVLVAAAAMLAIHFQRDNSPPAG